MAPRSTHFRRHLEIGRSPVAGPVTLSRLGVYRPSCRISTPLDLGDGGAAVFCLRQFLAGRGRPVPLVGPYNGRVANAVRTLESRRGLAVDGIADEQFLRVIGAWRS